LFEIAFPPNIFGASKLQMMTLFEDMGTIEVSNYYNYIYFNMWIFTSVLIVYILLFRFVLKKNPQINKCHSTWEIDTLPLVWVLEITGIIYLNLSENKNKSIYI